MQQTSEPQASQPRDCVERYPGPEGYRTLVAYDAAGRVALRMDVRMDVLGDESALAAWMLAYVRGNPPPLRIVPP